MADNPPTSKRSSAFKSDDLPPPIPAAERDRMLARELQRSRVLERRAPEPQPAPKKK